MMGPPMRWPSHAFSRVRGIAMYSARLYTATCWSAHPAKAGVQATDPRVLRDAGFSSQLLTPPRSQERRASVTQARRFLCSLINERGRCGGHVWLAPRDREYLLARRAMRTVRPGATSLQAVIRCAVSSADCTSRTAFAQGVFRRRKIG